MEPESDHSTCYEKRFLTFFVPVVISTVKKRKVLSIEDKVAIIDAVSNGEKKDVATRFCIPPSTRFIILMSTDDLLKAVDSGACSGKRKKLRAAMYEDVYKAVFKWFTDMRAMNVSLSGAVLQQKAKAKCLLGCDNFKASTG